MKNAGPASDALSDASQGRRFATDTLTVTVGICAFNEADRVGTLLDSVLAQEVPHLFVVKEIIVVASGCTDGTDDVVRAFTERDPRVRLVYQAERLGKASALNQLLTTSNGQLIVFVNADARLAPGAFAQLLPPFLESGDTWVACGAAALESPRGLPSVIEDVLWQIHNRVLSFQSTRNLGNHCCDELMAVRRGFVASLPPDLINDGAYLGVLAALSGHTVRFCEYARVFVVPPSTVRGWLERRRRILRGHRQVRLLLHRAPNTFESLSRRDPLLAARILASEIRDNPRSLLVLLLLAIPLEALSLALALSDGFRNLEYQAVWPKVDSS